LRRFIDFWNFSAVWGPLGGDLFGTFVPNLPVPFRVMRLSG